MSQWLKPLAVVIAGARCEHPDHCTGASQFCKINVAQLMESGMLPLQLVVHHVTAKVRSSRMLEHLRENNYQQGCRDRDRGLLPTKQDSAYLEGYLKGRPEGLDGIVQYFPSIEAYIKWKYKD